MLSVQVFPTLNEAAGHLSGGAVYLAGGTLVMRRVNYGAAGLSGLVRATDPTIRSITAAGGGVRIGAGATMADVIAAPETAGLAVAAHSVGGPAIRNMATVGGNLFAPHPYGDFATALLALDARVEWADGRSEPMDSFLAGRANASGLVAAVTVPRVSGSEFRFRKMVRSKPAGASLVSIAVWLPGGRTQNCRIAFGAMGPTPLRAKAAEAALDGARLDTEGIQPALQACLQGLAPVDDPLASAWYRAEVAPIQLARLLLDQGGYEWPRHQ
ncbi:MAG: FAD binding domain-containing protein [Pseudomonadota bacterium]